jgi:hypothetical protein
MYPGSSEAEAQPLRLPGKGIVERENSIGRRGVRGEKYAAVR